MEGCGADSHLAAGVLHSYGKAMSKPLPTLEQVKEVALRHLLPYGVEKVAIFGSYARGEAGEESDIDLLVVWDKPTLKPLSLFDLAGLIDDLSLDLGRKVDIVNPTNLRPNKRRLFEEDSIVIYEAA